MNDRNQRSMRRSHRLQLIALCTLLFTVPSCTQTLRERWGCAPTANSSDVGGGGDAGSGGTGAGGGATTGGGSCAPLDCVARGMNCGVVDNCGSVLDCGSCPSNQQCDPQGHCVCAPTDCIAQGADCGLVDDGCGVTLNCGGCAPAEKCDAQHQCVCKPVGCFSQGIDCGPVDDGCGALLNCGSCAAGQECDASGTCVTPCGPMAVLDQAKCGVAGYPYWCANNHTCWNGVTDCWSAVDCNGDGDPEGSCMCGAHYECDISGNGAKCQSPTLPPPCINAVQDLAHCPADFPFWCAANDDCWSAPTDCASQTDCDDDGFIDRACWCGGHVDCDLPPASSCLAW